VDRTVADPMIGRLLDGRYRVGPRIARGGMATVYEATDLRLDRVCALKVMHAGLGEDDDFAARFVREARSAARLSHPHVVSVFDQGDDGGTLFLAMEYIPGHTLRDLVRKESPMAPAKALALIEPVLSALAAAHEAGIIHRDVKPENVLLADDGRIKVADFGLARAVSAETQHTGTTGVLIGTVSYLSPELVVDGRADARSDVYAAGVLIYEMLTGRKPHEGESPIQVAYKHVHEDVPAPSRVVGGIPPYVDALVARATARDRGLRPADARVLLHQVRRVRGALDHGITDDPELTSDLTPTAPVFANDSIDYVREDAPTIIEPAHVGGVDGERTAAYRRYADPLPAARPSSPGRAPAGSGPRPPRRSRRGPVLLVLVLLLATLAGVGGWYYGMGRYTATPGVINLSEAQARDKIQAAGLTFAVGGREYSETITAGSVIRTDPAPGSDVLKDGTVTAVVSRGPERYEVPALRGMTEGQAQAALEEARLSFGDVTERWNEKVAEGVVLRSEPAAGTGLKPDTAVDLVVSKGPRPIPVPDFTGKKADKAEAELTERGFAVTVDSRHDDDVPEGDVISQSPRDGTLFRGDTVELLVSDGPELVKVPSVAGAGVDEATRTMQAAGFEVRTEKSALYVGLEYVVDTDPKKASMVPRGSVITLFLV
jgi:beta-lactam-binding protein with PASTA domain